MWGWYTPTLFSGGHPPLCPLRGGEKKLWRGLGCTMKNPPDFTVVKLRVRKSELPRYVEDSRQSSRWNSGVVPPLHGTLPEPAGKRNHGEEATAGHQRRSSALT